MMKTIGDRLIELREANVLTKLDMAKRLGVNKSSITRYESNEIKPNLDMMIKISQTFGVTLDWIAGIENNLDKEELNRYAAYKALINECMENNIPPEKLRKAIDLLKD